MVSKIRQSGRRTDRETETRMLTKTYKNKHEGKKKIKIPRERVEYKSAYSHAKKK